ncbi:MAG: potassium channel family protein, partial [Ktedonobacterales bacterium]
EQFHVRALRAGGVTGSSTLATADHVTVLGPLRAIQSLYAAGYASTLAPGLASTTLPAGQRDHIIICGLGKVGYRVVRWLTTMPNPPRVTAVYLEDDEHISFVRQLSATADVTTLHGDARDAETLLAAGLREASVVAAITSDDLTNLRIALEARRLCPDVHIVLRVFSDSLAEHLVDLFGIHTAYSTSELASPTLAAAAVLGDVSHGFVSKGTLYAMGAVPATAGRSLAGRTIEELMERYPVVVIAGIRRMGAVAALPAHGLRVEPGDELLVVAPLKALAKMRHEH